MEERSFVEEARREKRAALEALGVPAFAYRYERTHSARAALEFYRDEMGEAGPRVRIAGRIDRLGSHGKTSFAHIEDCSGRIQVYFRQDALGESYEVVESAGPGRPHRRRRDPVPHQEGRSHGRRPSR